LLGPQRERFEQFFPETSIRGIWNLKESIILKIYF
jgi:hypothetical protein